MLTLLLELLRLQAVNGSSVLGSKDFGRDERHARQPRSDADTKLTQAGAVFEQYIALDRPDIAYAVKTALQAMG